MFEEGSFFDKYFNVNLSDYPAFGFDFNVSLLTLGIFIGIIIAVVITTVRRSASTLVLRQLLRHEATGEAEAKTLSDVGLLDKRCVKSALSTDKMLRRFVSLVGEEEPSYEEYTAMTKEERAAFEKRSIDFSTAAFFIPEEKVEAATKALQSDTSSPITAAFLCLVLCGAYVLISVMMPQILSFASSLLG